MRSVKLLAILATLAFDAVSARPLDSTASLVDPSQVVAAANAPARDLVTRECKRALALVARETDDPLSGTASLSGGSIATGLCGDEDRPGGRRPDATAAGQAATAAGKKEGGKGQGEEEEEEDQGNPNAEGDDETDHDAFADATSGEEGEGGKKKGKPGQTGEPGVAGKPGENNEEGEGTGTTTGQGATTGPLDSDESIEEPGNKVISETPKCDGGTKEDGCTKAAEGD